MEIFSGKFGRILEKIRCTRKNLPAPSPACCTITDLGIFSVFFSTVLGIFEVACVRALIQ